MSIVLDEEQKLDLDALELKDVIVDEGGTYARKDKDKKNIESLKEKLKNGIKLDPISVQPIYNYPYDDEEDHDLTIETEDDEEKVYEDFAVLINAGGGHRKVSYEEYNKWRKKENKKIEEKNKKIEEKEIDEEKKDKYLEMKPNFKIADSSISIDYKKNFSNLLIRDFQDNDDQGLGNRNKDTETTAKRLAKKNPEWKVKKIADELSRDSSGIGRYVKDIKNKQKASRKSLAHKLTRLGWTQKEIGEIVGKSQNWVSDNIEKLSAQHLDNLKEKGTDESSICDTHDIDIQTLWSYLLEEKDDKEKFKKLNITKKKFTVWNYTEAHDLMGDESFDGRIPGQIPFNAIHRWSSQDDLVVDPMAGSGTTQDACLLLNRENKSYDINPQRNSIVKNDINNGLPIDKADFVFVNPPYWNMVDYEEGGSDQPLTKFYEETMTNLIQESYRILDKGNYFALIIANQSAKKWLEKSDETKNMHRLDHVLRTIDLAQDNNFDLQWRIYTSQPTQNAQRWAQAEWDEDRLAEIGRELLIFRREE